MLLGFKERFAADVESGAKTHTIRGRRKIPVKLGEICHCYVNPRQKTMRLLGRFRCTKIQEVTIDRRPGFSCGLRVWIDGVELTPDEGDLFFDRDGFHGASPYLRGPPVLVDRNPP